MSLKVCTSENMLSRSSGMGFSRGWFPRLVSERMATSVRDGSVDRAPDVIPFIDTSLLWTNTADSAQHLTVSMHRASRSMVSSNPNLLVLGDAWSFDIGKAPQAPLPTVSENGIGIRLKGIPSTSANNVFGRIFRDTPDFVSYVEVGLVEPGDTVHFRYRALFSTPGEWRAATNPRHEVSARWCRLRLWASPWLDGSV